MAWVEVSADTVSAPRYTTRPWIDKKGGVHSIMTKTLAGTYIETTYHLWVCYSCKRRACTTGGHQPSACCCGAR